MRRDLYNNVATVQSLAPAARTASANGSSADLQDYDAALIVVSFGTWTDGTHTIEVQESDDDSTFTAVADAHLQGTEPVVDAADEDEVIHELGYIGYKRYIRVATTVATATTGAVYGASIVRGNPNQAPTR